MLKKKTSTKSFPVRVRSLDAELTFDLPWASQGRDLHDLTCRTLGLRETWYFGLQFTTSKGIISWLQPDKKVRDQDLPKEPNPTVEFLFLVKFYPEDCAEELVQDLTQHLFYLQVNQAILQGDIYCPPECSVLLASYQVQAQWGDYEEQSYMPGYLNVEGLLPQRVITQYKMTGDMWEERIKVWWQDHWGMSREESEIEYLKIAQDLDMYGVNYFLISNKKDSELWLGVTALGLNIYEKENKLTPKINFPWGEIRNISFDDKKFTIKPVDKQSPNFTFFSQKPRINKMIMDLCIGNHELYMRRRRPDPMDLQQMKVQAQEIKRRRQVERQKLAREKRRREEVEREKMVLEETLGRFQEEMGRAREQLRRSEEAAELLAEKVRIAEEEATLLRLKAGEAQREAEGLRETAIKSEEEKMMMERKMREVEGIVVRMVGESDNRLDEAERLKQELLKARLAEKDAKDKLLQFLTHPSPSPESVPPLVNTVPLGHFVPPSPTEVVPKEQVVAAIQQQMPEEPVELGDPISVELERERREYLEKSRSLEGQLRELKDEIEKLKLEDKESPYDINYRERVTLGENKYATLKKVKGGSTRERVAFFEEL